MSTHEPLAFASPWLSTLQEISTTPPSWAVVGSVTDSTLRSGDFDRATAIAWVLPVLLLP
ncbi:hypothetical protein D3C85_1831550 [compost metagenome]